MSWAKPSIQRELQRGFDGEVLLSVPMKDHTSFRVGGPADLVAIPRTREDLRRILKAARSMAIPYRILGGGTNLLVTDLGIRGLVIRLGPGFGGVQEVEDRARNPEDLLLKVGAATALKGVLSHCLVRGYRGMEFSVGIPGTFGGAIVGNSGGRYGEMQGVVHSVLRMDPEGAVHRMGAEALRFSYRHLDLPPGSVVLEGTLLLKRGDREEIRRRLKEGMVHRFQTQPLGLPSAGCIFQNPPEGPAGRIIEACGLKGIRIGGAQVSQKHANFIVNRGGARASDILELIEIVRVTVLREKGITLDLEVEICGEGYESPFGRGR